MVNNSSPQQIGKQPPVTPPVLEKFKGTLLGCAVGDALGAPLEGMPRELIKSKYGRVVEFLDSPPGPGRITDDTQMTTLLAQSIVETGKFELEHTAEKFGRWMEYSDKGIKPARGVGAACAEACRRLYRGSSPYQSGIDSASCGSAMRASPIGLRYHRKLDLLKKAAVEQSMLTHTDPRAHAGAVVAARAVAEGIRHRGRFEPKSFLLELANAVEDISQDMAEKVRGLIDYLDRDIGEGLNYAGVGGFVMETVPAALLVFLRSPFDLEETLLEAVNGGGDTDSIGAIAGAVSGSFNGMGAIPARLLSEVEGRSYLEDLAFRLYTVGR